MKITLGKLTFENTLQFTDYLKHIYEQDKSDFQKLLSMSYAVSESESGAEDNDATVRLWIKILTIFRGQITSENSGLMLDILDGLEIHHILLKEIAGLFEYPPFPTISGFVGELANSSKELQRYIDAYDRDPHGIRAVKYNKHQQLIKTSEQIRAEQFDTTQVKRVVANISSILSSVHLSTKQQYDLIQQVIYINAVGKDFPLSVNKKTYSDLSSLTRTGLRELSDLLIDQIRDLETDEQERLKAELNLFAVMREQYFRSTGLFINTTQIISALLALHHQQVNVLLDVNSDEFQYSTTALISAMQWVMADGGAVDVWVENRDVLTRDYVEKGARNFFTSLGILSSEVLGDSLSGTYQVGGINYSTPSDTTSYRARAEIDHEQLSKNKYGYAGPNNLILDGILSSGSTKQMIEFYRKQGHIIAISSGLRSKEELVEQCDQLNIDHAYSVPSHVNNARKKSLAFAATDDAVLLQKIKNIIDINKKNRQPIIVIAKDDAHAKLIKQELEAQFKREKKSIEIAALTDGEPEATRLAWISEHTTKPNTITVITSSLARTMKLSTEHPKGFIAIQAYQDAIHVTKALLSAVAGEEGQGKYVLIQEESGDIFTRSWSFKSEEDRKNIIDTLIEINRIRREDVAFELYIKQAVSAIQKVVLQQFDEWQGLLHRVHLRSEWKTLGRELVMHREHLLGVLAEQWTQCLHQSDPDNSYPNPYVRRAAGNKLQTAPLETLLKYYEECADTVWKSKRTTLKAMIETRISKDSVNALRCKYLEDVELREQIQLNKLVVRQNKKAAVKEKKISQRFVESALNVYGAMLSYGDGEIEQYRIPFIDGQLESLARDISKEINNSSLSGPVKSGLIERINNADNLFALVLILIDYDSRWLGSEKFSEKYRMQPIVGELLRVHHHSGLEHFEELDLLKQNYLDNALLDITGHLEHALSWAKPKSQGLGYFLERSAVKVAAAELLTALDVLKKASNSAEKKAAIQNLYKVLARNQAQIEDLWIFSFGHKNMRDLINETLNALDGLTVLDIGNTILDADFIRGCKDVAYAELVKTQLAAVMTEVEDRNSSVLNGNIQWDALKNEIGTILNTNDSIYVFDELGYFLSKQKLAASNSSSKLFNPIHQLNRGIQILKFEYQQKHPELFSETDYHERKAQKIRKELEAVDGFSVKNVTLKAGTTGFSNHLDLIIDGRGSIPLLQQFTHYNSSASILEKDRSDLLSSLRKHKGQLLHLQRLQHKQLPLLKPEVREFVDSRYFPVAMQKLVDEILYLKDLVTGENPGPGSLFPEEIQESFMDRELLKSFDFTTMSIEQINQLKDPQLKSEFLELFKKIDYVEPPKPWYARLASYVTNAFRLKESMDDWRYEFTELKGRKERFLQAFLYDEIDTNFKELNFDIIVEQQFEALEIESLNEKIVFVNDRIAEEFDKEGIIIKRFESFEQIYDFEAELRSYKALHPRVSAVQPQSAIDKRKDQLEQLPGDAVVQSPVLK